MIDLSKLYVSAPILEDLPGLLDISKGHYEGHDYLEHVFPFWVQEEASNPSGRRRSLVLLLSDDQRRGTVIGFRSFFLQDAERKVVCQALRIGNAFKGQGVGRRFLELCDDYLAQINPQVLSYALGGASSLWVIQKSV